MKLHQYPAAIAAATEAVNQLDQDLGELRQLLAAREGQADLIVAFEELKNDAQRKARRFEILQLDEQYLACQSKLLELTTAKANAFAYLEQLRNQFSVAKLEARWAIAEKLMGLEARELVGL